MQWEYAEIQNLVQLQYNYAKGQVSTGDKRNYDAQLLVKAIKLVDICVHINLIKQRRNA